ncbi:MAG: 4Fe-4S binding protein, partial [Desulfomonilaceae bacterium]
ALVLGKRAQLLDCDVEEPNCHILLKPIITTTETVSLPIPAVDLEKCSLCGKCGEVCQFSAIVPIGKTVIAFPELCHGCGACSMLCPEGAIREVPRNLGVVETGIAGSVEFVQGRIRIGEAMAPPLIRAVKSRISVEKLAILDAPPGASCPVITTVKGADFVIMVTEPTPFGLNDLEIAVTAIQGLGIPMGIVINRSDIGDSSVKEFCDNNGLPLLMEIPHHRKIAEGYAQGKPLIESIPEYSDKFMKLADDVTMIVDKTSKGSS